MSDDALDAEHPLICAITYCQEAAIRLDDGGQAKTAVEAACANLETVLDEEFRSESEVSR